MDSSTRCLLLILLASSSLLILFPPSPARAQPLPPHAPIFIESVAGFENFTQPTVNGGSGLPNDPYIIEGWNITTSSSAGIHIKNTQKFFVIRNVYIQRTNFTGESEGIYLDNVQNGRVETASITNFSYGVWLSLGSANTITTGSMWNNTVGIYMTGTNNRITQNHVYKNVRYGIWITSSTNNIFTGNNASSNGNGRCVSCDGAGFVISASSNNLFENNTLLANDFYGFRTIVSTGNTYRNNNVTLNQFGTIFEHSTSNIALQNNLTNNDFGFGLEFGNIGNNLTMNRVIGNTYGVYIVNGTRNMVYNNYLQNTNNAFDDWNYSKGIAPNAWNITKTLRTNILGGPFTGGNYYSDYQTRTVPPCTTQCDPDDDGMGNTPYPILGGTAGHPATDLAPLVLNQPTTVQDVSVRNVAAQPLSAKAGNTITITVQVFNEGTVSEPIFLVSVYANQQKLGTLTVGQLSPYSGTNLSLPWNTNGYGAGTYTLIANASTVPGETYTANNLSPPTTVHILANRSPIALFTVSTTTPVAGQAVFLDASPSSDPDGTIASYSWDLGDGTVSTGVTTTHAYTDSGPFTVTLLVTDNDAISSTFSISLTVSSNQPSAPTNFQLTATTGKATLTWSPPSSTGGSVIAVYRIYRGTSPSGPFTWLANTTDTTFEDTTVSNGHTYYYKVTAVNNAGDESPIENSTQKDVLIPGAMNVTNGLPLWLGIAAGVIVAVAATAVVILRQSKPRNMIA